MHLPGVAQVSTMTFSHLHRAIPYQIVASVIPEMIIPLLHQIVLVVIKIIITPQATPVILQPIFQRIASLAIQLNRDGNQQNSGNTIHSIFQFIQDNTMGNGALVRIVIQTQVIIPYFPVSIAMNIINQI